jgi:DNA-directed RNA polymerase specialized sigma24 family protein
MLAEEATQDTFLKLWSRAHTYLAERGSLLLWLLTIARRTALDRLRLETRRPMLPLKDPRAWQTIPDANSLPENRPAAYFAVQALSPDRQVNWLTTRDGQSEIAGCWAGRLVRKTACAAMERLRQDNAR